MTHQTLSLGKYWKLLQATSNGLNFNLNISPPRQQKKWKYEQDEANQPFCQYAKFWLHT